MVNIKGQDFKEIAVRDAYNRRALHFKNEIMTSLKTLGIIDDDIEVPLESLAMRKAPASVSWYVWDRHLFFSYHCSSKFAENLGMVAQVIDHFVKQVTENSISPESFLKLFEEDQDILKQRKSAREILGVEKDSFDFDIMHQKFKKLSKAHHPDMSDGNTEQFQKINNAHKILKKELC